ncbi:MAG: hypothetical protein ACRCZI_09765 [Cetobacterium sp.]
MAPDTLLFGRLTHNGKRINLGRAPITILLTRALEEMRKLRKSDEMVIQMEFGTSKLPDSTTFDKLTVIEQQLAQNIMTDPNEESPFPGITIGRVTEVMMSPQYIAYEAICEPTKRMGLPDFDITMIRDSYVTKFPDCSPHFPKWID